MGSISLDDGPTGSGPSPTDKFEPLAIIGLDTRFPQEATTTEKLWEFLLRARSAMTRFPPERLNAEAFYHPDPEHGGTVRTDSSSFSQK